MWEKIGDFTPGGNDFLIIPVRRIKYKNTNADSKIGEISLFTTDREPNFIRIVLKLPISKNHKIRANLQSIFKDAELAFGNYGRDQFYFDVTNVEGFKPFFNALQIFEPSIISLKADLTRKVNRDYTDYPLEYVAPVPLLVQANLSQDSKVAIPDDEQALTEDSVVPLSAAERMILKKR